MEKIIFLFIFIKMLSKTTVIFILTLSLFILLCKKCTSNKNCIPTSYISISDVTSSVSGMLNKVSPQIIDKVKQVIGPLQAALCTLLQASIISQSKISPLGKLLNTVTGVSEEYAYVIAPKPAIDTLLSKINNSYQLSNQILLNDIKKALKLPDSVTSNINDIIVKEYLILLSKFFYQPQFIKNNIFPNGIFIIWNIPNTVTNTYTVAINKNTINAICNTTF